MNYGTSKRIMRDKLPVEVLVGWTPTEPLKLSSQAPPIDDSAIKSGMVVKKVTGTVLGQASQVGFQKAAAVDKATDVSFFIAIHDGDSHDVQASGYLVGLDCSDNFEIRTGYFDPAQTWAVDDPLTVGNDGILAKAAAGDKILGYVTAIGAGTNNALPYVGHTPSAEDSLVIQFKTAHSGATVPSA